MKRPDYAAKIVDGTEEINYFGPGGAGDSFQDPEGTWWDRSSARTREAENCYVRVKAGKVTTSFDDGRTPRSEDYYENRCPKCNWLVSMQYGGLNHFDDTAEGGGHIIGYHYTCANCEKLLEWVRFG